MVGEMVCNVAVFLSLHCANGLRSAVLVAGGTGLSVKPNNVAGRVGGVVGILAGRGRWRGWNQGSGNVWLVGDVGDVGLASENQVSNSPPLDTIFWSPESARLYSR